MSVKSAQLPRQLAREEESELWEEMKEAGVGGIFEKSGEEVAKITLYRLFLNSFSFKRKCRSDSFLSHCAFSSRLVDLIDIIEAVGGSIDEMDKTVILEANPYN